MTRTQRIRLRLAALFFLLLLLLAGAAWAGSADHYDVDWFVLGSGGAPAESSSGTVVLNGTLGQTAIGPSAASHGSLGAGFWHGVGERRYAVYLPLVLRHYN